MNMWSTSFGAFLFSQPWRYLITLSSNPPFSIPETSRISELGLFLIFNLNEVPLHYTDLPCDNLVKQEVCMSGLQESLPCPSDLSHQVQVFCLLNGHMFFSRTDTSSPGCISSSLKPKPRLCCAWTYMPDSHGFHSNWETRRMEGAGQSNLVYCPDLGMHF